MRKNLRTVLTLSFALAFTVATAGPVGGYGVEKAAKVTTSLGSAK